jgi:putative membrane protein insertion efficiency factor
MIFRMVGYTLIGAVLAYRAAIRPFLPPLCPYYPTCSEYMIQAIQKYGPFSGAARGMARLCRCHPFCRGGYDPP